MTNDPTNDPEQIGIKVEGVSKRFGDFQALEDITLDVPSGSLTALLGPSGSGKSTLLRLIAGLETADTGRVLLGGQDVTGMPVQQRGIGFVFQHYAAFKHMTVRENIAFGLKIRKTPRDQIRDRVKELIRLVQLQGMAHRYPSQLSGGQRQRMALARALAAQPKLLLLDEPFGALDATVRKELRTWLRHMHDEVNVTTIFVTHDQEEALDVAEQIVVMNAGRIEQTGKPRELYENPRTEFVMSFVGEVNRFGNALIRPHDLDLGLVKVDGAEEAMVERVSHLGFEVRVELSMASGDRAWAQVTRAEADELELEQGQIIFARPSQSKVFESGDVRTRRAPGSDPADPPSGTEPRTGRLVYDRPGRTTPTGIGTEPGARSDARLGLRGRRGDRRPAAMTALELAAAALIVGSLIVCVLAVVASAAEAGRIAARRLQVRASARADAQRSIGPGCRPRTATSTPRPRGDRRSR